MNTMTWGEFKKYVDQTEGVTDNTPINYIDISYPMKHDDGRFDIQECVVDGDDKALVVWS